MRRLGTLALVAVLASLLPACSRGGGGYEIAAVFETGISLYAGSQVKVLGLPAGKITSVKVDGAVVRVRMRIDGDVPVPAAAEATIIPSSLIGERYVQLSPAWTEGTTKIRPGAEIPLERTSVPVEPDEALAALKAFLDALDPDATGRLVRNLADDLEGNGVNLNRTLAGLATLTTTLAAKDEQLGNLVDNFDELTATLVTREARIAEALRDFATLTATLAAERTSIERLLNGLGALSRDGLELISEHRVALDRDIKVLTRTLQMVDANLDNVGMLLDSTPTLLGGNDYSGRESGLVRAVDPVYHRLDLRISASPLLSSVLNPIGLPIQPVCIPADTTCAAASTRGGSRPSRSPSPAADSAASAPAPVELPATPVAPRARPGRGVEIDVAPPPARSGPAGWARSLARLLAGVMA